MKLGIPLLVIGVALLVGSIPYSILAIVAGVTQEQNGIFSRGFASYLGIIGVILGFVLVTIGATRVFKR